MGIASPLGANSPWFGDRGLGPRGLGPVCWPHPAPHHWDHRATLLFPGHAGALGALREPSVWGRVMCRASHTFLCGLRLQKRGVVFSGGAEVLRLELPSAGQAVQGPLPHRPRGCDSLPFEGLWGVGHTVGAR